MTVDDKIEEAEYNLKKLKTVSNEQEFQFELSNYLSSCYSILQHFLEEKKYEFGLKVDYLTNKTFREEANKKRNRKAIKFINWFIEEQQKLRNNKSYGFLWAKRNHTVHKNTVKPDGFRTLEIGITPVWRDISTGELSEGKRNAKKVTWLFFKENKTDDAIMLCNNFLTHIKKIINDAKRT